MASLTLADLGSRTVKKWSKKKPVKAPAKDEPLPKGAKPSLYSNPRSK